MASSKRKIHNIPDISFGKGNVHGHISFDRLKGNMDTAQWWLGEQVLADCKPYMPIRTGSLQQRSHTEDNGRKVVFPGPYGHFQYEGLLMVDPETNSPWARKGAKKVYTDRLLQYSNPKATRRWFETAKANHGGYWIGRVKQIAGGKK